MSAKLKGRDANEKGTSWWQVMGVPGGMTESEMGSWLFRIGMGVVGFFLCLGIKDAKKSIDLIPGLKAKQEEMEKAQETLFRRLEKLEQR